MRAVHSSRQRGPNTTGTGGGVYLIGNAVAKGAKLGAGGQKIGNQGFFYAPSVISEVPLDADIMTEEPFAPVMPILDFSKIDDVIAQANNTKYGLAAYVFTNDITVGGQDKSGNLAPTGSAAAPSATSPGRA